MKTKLKLLTIAVFVLGSLEPARANNTDIPVSAAQLNTQCIEQYGQAAFAQQHSPSDAKSWKCHVEGSPPLGISVRSLCKRVHGENYYARAHGATWVCRRRAI